MIPNETLQSIESVGIGVEVVGNFDITDKTKARILVSLSDKMYTRKQLASVREYSTNAADAHIVVKKPISEIVVTLPTMNDLNLRIRDFGTGLTEREIATVYAIFGESTKRNSDEFNGLLGYGCKAGFASTDSFTVTSWINGEKTIYQCIKGDSTKLHSVLRLSREASSDPSGIEVTIPVKQDAVWTFHREAVDFYKYWPVMPTIVNLTDEEKERLEKFRAIPATLKGDNWEIRPSDNGAEGIAYMGWVPYQIDWKVLYHKMSLDSKKRVLFDLLQKNNVTLYFKMGEVNFVDSREHLEYTEITLKSLMERIEGIFAKIKDAIQEKFDPCPNLWEAKRMYNSIFGTGVLELEKGENDNADMGTRIKILDGNLMHLESTFRGSFKWNGIVLDDASFERINRFDNSKGADIGGREYTPLEPVMITYRKKKSRAKVNRCKGGSANNIVASSQVAVVINDTGMKSGQSMVSRYIIFGQNKGVKSVHVLNFTNKDTKAAFYKEYSFDSVPLIKLSEIIGEAKTWNNANKVSRSYKSSGGGDGTRTLKYMDIEAGTVEEDEVPIREIAEGGFYVQVGEVRRRRWRNGHTTVVTPSGFTLDAAEAVTHIKVLAKEMDLDIDRVYLINNHTSETKWFKEAVASGEWTLAWPQITDALSDLDMPTLLNADSFNGITDVCEKAAKYLKENILEKNSPMMKLIGLVADKAQEKNMELVSALRDLHMWDTAKGTLTPTVDYDKVNQAAHDSYPFLSWNDVENDYYATPEKLKLVVDYVNAMDLYVDLTTDHTAKPVAAEATDKVEVAA